MSKRPRWTAQELALLRELYPHHHTADVALAIGRQISAVYRRASALGLRKTAEWIRAIARDRTMMPGHGSHAKRFMAGHTAWNKGVKGVTGTHPHSVVNHFKTGQCNGRAAQLLRPLGAMRVNDDGTLQRKMREDGRPQDRWVAVHRLVWQAAHGPVPAGHVVAFRPGTKTTDEALITLDRLELITRAENMRRNSFHNNLPPELAKLVQLRGALNRMINHRTKDAAE
jgi:hypothetical protein